MIKTCIACNLEKNLSDFRKDRSRKDGYRSSCKVCDRSYHRSKHAELYGPQRAKRDKDLRDENRNKLTEFKRKCGCRYCSEVEPVCLEFHHLDPSQKDFTISTNTHRTWKYIQEEVLKCIVVCSNCHKKIHAGLIMVDIA